MRRRPALLVACALLAGCRTLEGTGRASMDPVVVVHGPEGDELGVSTEYGVVFLGRHARGGRIEFTAWFGDGPAREEGLVEAVGGGIFATESEIVLPSAPLCFEELPAGTPVVVRGRRAGQPFEIEAVLAADERVEGILLRAEGDLERLSVDETGAGVFLLRPGEPVRLVGLVSGRLELGEGRRFVTVVGPESLWRLVVQRRNPDRPRRQVYREDIL
jgi:hypothetical protein